MIHSEQGVNITLIRFWGGGGSHECDKRHWDVTWYIGV